MMAAPDHEEPKTYEVPERLTDRSGLLNDFQHFKTMHNQSLEDPDTFWSKIADEFYWHKKWDRVNSHQFNVEKGPIDIKWFEGGETNVCYNCVDRHVEAGQGNKVAFFFEGNDPNVSETITYKQLHVKVCKLANALKKLGIQKGDRVVVYMPMIIELVVAVLACARIGAIHSVVFGGFSGSALASRIIDSTANVLLTADGAYRGKKKISFNPIIKNALEICKEAGVNVDNILCKNWVNDKTDQVADYMDYDEFVSPCSRECPIEWMDAEDPLFMLYTSGSTGTPKGVLHTNGGYMIYAATTFKYAFDYQDGDVYWCTADLGWITGHTYIAYGPLLNGATSVLFEGVPTYPDCGRFWQLCEKHHVNQFYTAPTAIRMLMSFGDEIVDKYDLSSLRVLGTVGEPINPEAWLWYYDVIGKGKCAVVDTYWQTETGGHVVLPVPSAVRTKPGSCTLPFFGVKVSVVRADGTPADPMEEGCIVFDRPWPGLMRSIYNDHNRFEKTYFSMFPGYYCAGDGGYFDKDGYLWVVGRIDDVMSVSGHRIGTADVEGAIAKDHRIAEAAAVGVPHDIKGQSILVLVVMKDPKDDLDVEHVKQIKQIVRSNVGAFAVPETIVKTAGLPKTRSGKIMRRIIRKLSHGDGRESLGDCSTLSDPTVIDTLLESLEPTLNKN